MPDSAALVLSTSSSGTSGECFLRDIHVRDFTCTQVFSAWLYPQVSKDLELHGQLEQVKSELAPLEKQYLKLVQSSSKHRDMIAWGGMYNVHVYVGLCVNLSR